MHHIHPRVSYALCPLAERGCGFVADSREQATHHYHAVHATRQPKIKCPLAGEGCPFTADSHEQIKQHFHIVHGNPAYAGASLARPLEIPSLHNLVHDMRPPPSTALGNLMDHPVQPECYGAPSMRKPVNGRTYTGPLEIQFGLYSPSSM
ncbi:hypothetical protein Hypma_013918 [Hypsizygus marmoreus]|uniref:Uncharacterized protein n=1 Tax=Hypsizygus marmoreus TaxID=39966 RepID=A0A369K7H4_HYPMA|nr:hypothetical protein Hypma_013918 [Hypsizygus marmoreus]